MMEFIKCVPDPLLVLIVGRKSLVDRAKTLECLGRVDDGDHAVSGARERFVLFRMLGQGEHPTHHQGLVMGPDLADRANFWMSSEIAIRAQLVSRVDGGSSRKARQVRAMPAVSVAESIHMLVHADGAERVAWLAMRNTWLPSRAGAAVAG